MLCWRDVSPVEVRDVSSLGEVEDLNIRGCRNISDISCLTRVNSLRISLSCITRGSEVLENDGYNLTAEFLNKLKASSITVAYNNSFSDTSLLVGRPRTTVAISDCPFVVDISSLSKVNSVLLHTMSGITNVSALAKCLVVYMSKCENVIDVSSLRNLSQLKWWKWVNN